MKVNKNFNGVFTGRVVEGMSCKLQIIDRIKSNPNAIVIEPNGEISNFILGTLGQGKAYHPWDNLKICVCGGSAWMEGKDGGNFEEGAPYRIRCCKCGKHTKYGEVEKIKNEWNTIQEVDII
jgi:hypothetical protein